MLTKCFLKSTGLLSTLICATIISGALFSCKREVSLQSDTAKPADYPLLKESKSFTEKLKSQPAVAIKTTMSASKEAKSSSKNNTVIHSKVDQRQANLLEKLSWDKAAQYEYAGSSYLLVPTNEPVKPFKNAHYEFERCAIFQNNVSGINMSILEILSKKDNSLGENRLGLLNTAFQKAAFNRVADFSKISANVFLFDKAYQNQQSFSIENGNWSLLTERIIFRSDLEISQ